ncbi:MAG: ABC transporter permease subunit [Zoogloeaceae bacterium]|jgi:NitT/TauT family transport system permease protein|nr:ABC transporter permease subunit [Zoogloeaceae bacterium]
MSATATLELPLQEGTRLESSKISAPYSIEKPRATPPSPIQATEMALALPTTKSEKNPGFRFFFFGLAAVAAWSLLGGLTLGLPDKVVGFFESWPYTQEFGIGALLFAALWFALTFLASFDNHRLPRLLARVAGTFRHAVPWLIVFALILATWEVLTAKTLVLEPPFFAPPSSIFDAYVNDYARLLDSAYNSLKLLFKGILWGATVGFVVGVSIGWSKRINYWVHPILRLIGPLPPTALLPIAFVFFSTSHAASIFLIALATGFPVAILSWSGVASVNKAYYDVARTLGASEFFLIFRVAIPAALPQVFVGLFMGLGASFVVLIVAEMMGVKSGLGWYLEWAKGYADYIKMYSTLIVMTLIFSGLISLLFAVRDRVLVWQKGTVKW